MELGASFLHTFFLNCQTSSLFLAMVYNNKIFSMNSNFQVENEKFLRVQWGPFNTNYEKVPSATEILKGYYHF